MSTLNTMKPGSNAMTHVGRQIHRRPLDGGKGSMCGMSTDWRPSVQQLHCFVHGTHLIPSGPDLYSDSGIDLLLRPNSCSAARSSCNKRALLKETPTCSSFHTFLKPGKAAAGWLSWSIPGRQQPWSREDHPLVHCTKGPRVPENYLLPTPPRLLALVDGHSVDPGEQHCDLSKKFGSKWFEQCLRSPLTACGRTRAAARDLTRRAASR